MKQKLLSASLSVMLGLFVFTTTTFAQEQQTDKETGLVSKFGVKGGVNFANLYVNDNNISDRNMKVGYNIGLFAKLPLTRGLSFQPELLYSTKGSKIDFSVENGEYRFNLNYVELPLLLAINLGENFHVELGPYLGYLAKSDITVLKNGDFDDVADLNENSFERWDLGGAIGAGFDIQKFTIGARYSRGFSNINKSTLLGQITPNSKNNVISAYIGFAF